MSGRRLRWSAQRLTPLSEFPLPDPSKRPAAVDPKLKPKLADAAASAGFDSLESMLLAIANSGLVGEMANQIADRAREEELTGVTLGDVSDVLVHKLSKTNAAQRVKFWMDLTPQQQGVLIVRLRRSGVSTIELCDLFMIDQEFVQNLWSRYVTRIGDVATSIPLEYLIGEMEVAADLLMSRAIQKGHVSAAWKILTERIDIYERFSLVERAPKDAGDSEAVGREDEEFNARVALEVKKKLSEIRRLENLKRAEFTVREKPEDEEDYDDDE